MAYDNINFNQYNMTIANSYFYMFDWNVDTLVEKLDDGSISFTYPLDIDLSCSYIEDGFTGDDGDSPNSDLWEGFDPGVTIQDNKLELHSDSTDAFEYVNSVFNVFGNFEAQVDYELIAYPSTDQWQGALVVRLVDEDPFIEYRISRIYSTTYGHRYIAQDNASGSYLVRQTFSTTDTSGKFRMYRNGASLRCYYWSGTAWVQLYNWTVPISRAKIFMFMWSGGALPSATARFNNFSFHHELGYVKDTQYDGRNFWTFQSIENGGYVIRRWNIENYVCYLRDEFLYGDTTSHIYRGNTFGVEHYITRFDCTVSGGNDVLCLNEYYDSTVASGVTLFLGPNENGEQEEVTVSEVSGTDVVITSGTQYIYKFGDNINFYKSLFVFNDYYGLSSDKGILYKFDAYTGEQLSSQIDIDYKDVTASTFVRVQGALLDYPDMHTLLYVKSSNVKLRNMSDLLSEQYASSVNDDFTGADYDLPNTTRWSVVDGDPRILNNQLFMNSMTYDGESVKSNYDISGDFDVQISGSFYGMMPISGSVYSKHYMKLDDSITNCELGIYHNTGLVAMYTMDDIDGTTLVDASPNGNDGTITGAPTTVTGVTGNALYFRGMSYLDGVTLLSDSVAGSVEDLFSISMWFKSETTAGHYGARLITRDCSDYWCIYIQQNETFPQDIIFWYSDTQNITINDVVLQNTWHHLVVYWDRANTTCKLYLDKIEIFSTTSLAAFRTSSRPIVIGCNTEAALIPGSYPFIGPIDDICMYNLILGDDDIEDLYNNALPSDIVNSTYIYQGVDGIITDCQLLSSGVLNNYSLRIVKSANDVEFYYKTMVSGVLDPNWQYYNNAGVSLLTCKLGLGLTTAKLDVSSVVFDDLVYNSGKVMYFTDDVPYYGIMGIDNIRVDQITIIPIYNVSVRNQTLYRLQDEATYYGTNNDWGARYNYQVSPIRSFVDSITVAASPVILPANGYNISGITAVVTDQYGEGVRYKPVFLTDDDPDGYILTNPAYTDIFFGTGAATTSYRSGVIVHLVTIEGTATQYD